jgi:hypothetical protein
VEAARHQKRAKSAKKSVATVTSADYHSGFGRGKLMAAVTIGIANEVYEMVLTRRVNSAAA